MSIDLEFVKLVKRLYRKKPPTPCMFVGKDGVRCKNAAISSHTLQKAVTLKHIAESGHVYKLGMNPLDFKKRGVIGEIKIGLQKASVFPGFCKKHDQELFKEIELDKVVLDEKLSLLLGYRVVCMELHAKLEVEKMFTDTELRDRAKRIGSLDEIEAFLEGTLLGQADLDRAKARYEEALHAGNFAGFRATVIELQETLPFCFAAPFAPEFDFEENLILPAVEDDWESVAAFAGRIGNKDIFLISGFDRNEKHDLSRFIGGLAKLDSSMAGDVALQIALEYAENSYYKISWFDNLDPHVRYKMIRQFRSGIPGDVTRMKTITNFRPLISIGVKGKPVLIES